MIQVCVVFPTSVITTHIILRQETFQAMCHLAFLSFWKNLFFRMRLVEVESSRESAEQFLFGNNENPNTLSRTSQTLPSPFSPLSGKRLREEF